MTKLVQWTGIDKHGKRVSGTLKVADTTEAQLLLRRKEVQVISLKDKIGFNFSFGKRKITRREVLLFTRHLSTMVSSGLPIMQALDILAKEQDNPSMKEFIEKLRSNTSAGKPLADTFEEYKSNFNYLYCSLIRAGEKSGTLDKILKRLTDYLERSEAIRRKVRKALVYPAAVIFIAMVVSFVLLFYVVPQFETIFKSFGADLPVFTKMVLSLSRAMRDYWYIMLAVIIGFVMGFKYLIKTSETAKDILDRVSFKVFIIGSVLKNSIYARFTRTLAVTLEAGMPIIDAMKSMTEIVGSRMYRRALIQISNDIASGNKLNTAISSTKLFPNMIVQMISVGEESGSLSDMLNKIADYYEEEVNTTVDNLSSLLEPAIMAFIGVIVGGFVVAMYLPIFQIGSLV